MKYIFHTIICKLPKMNSGQLKFKLVELIFSCFWNPKKWQNLKMQACCLTIRFWTVSATHHRQWISITAEQNLLFTGIKLIYWKHRKTKFELMKNYARFECISCYNIHHFILVRFIHVLRISGIVEYLTHSCSSSQVYQNCPTLFLPGCWVKHDIPCAQTGELYP